MKAAQLLALAALLGFAGSALAGSDPVCQTYTIKSGDSPATIADKFSILPANLLQALQDQGIDYSTLQPGQIIYLYPYFGACQYVTSAGNDQDCQAYMVQTGDTLNGIASAFNIYVDDIVNENPTINSNGTGLKPGSYIKLPPWKSTCSEPGNQKPCMVYTAVAGDSLATIASMFQVTVDQLVSVNKDSSLDAQSVLKPNQRVKIYPYYDTCPDGGIPAVVPTSSTTECRAYVVQQGDSLASIAKMFGITVNDLIGVNPELSDPSLLTPGYTVKLPPYPDSCGTSIIVTSDSVSTTSSSSTVSAASIKTSPVVKAASTEAVPISALSPAVSSPAMGPVAASPAMGPSAAKAPAAAPKAAPAPSPSHHSVTTASTSGAASAAPAAAAALAVVGAVAALL